MVLLSLTCCLFGVLNIGFASARIGQPQRGYIITLPQVVVRGSDTEVCASFHEVRENVRVTMTLGEGTARQTFRFDRGLGRCVNFTVPASLSKRREQFRVLIDGEQSGPAPDEETAEVTVLQRNRLVFIQTDKPLYKAGQTVKIRIYIVDFQTRPVEEPIDVIWIENPDGYRIMEWRDEIPNMGLVEVALELAERTELGEWKIHVSLESYPDTEEPFSVEEYENLDFFTPPNDTTTLTFMVDEYVLPSFEVTVEAPKLFNTTKPNFPVRICAKYTYGKNVNGSYTLQLCQTPQQCPVKLGGPISSCTVINVKRDKLLGVASGTVGQFYVTVNVTNNATLETRASELHTVSYGGQGVILDLSSSPDYFKPNITYVGKVKATTATSSPAVGITVRTSAILGHEEHHGSVSHVTTDENGEAIFSVPIRANVGQFLLKAVISDSFRLLGDESEDKLEVKRWFSRGHRYLRITPASQFPACTNNYRFNVTYFHEDTLPKTTSLHYQIISRGHVIFSGARDVTLTPLQSPRTLSLSLPPPESVFFPGDIRINNRMYMETWKRMIIIPNPLQVITRAGHVIEWTIYARNRGIVFLQVWRLSSQDPPEDHVYTLIGQKQVLAGSQGRGLYEVVTLSHPIAVLPGDVIGMFFPKKNVIPYDSVTCPRNERALYFGAGSHGPPSQGTRHKFYGMEQPSWIPCREYPIRTKVQIDHEMEQRLEHKLIPGHFPFDVTTPEPLAPESRLLVYYVTDKETVADTAKVDTEACLRHKVSLQFASTQKRPGEPVTLQLTAAPDSRCAVGAVDASVHLMRAAHALSPQRVYEKLLKRMMGKQIRKIDLSQPTLVDTLEAFHSSGLQVISNMELETKPQMPLALPQVHGRPSPKPPVVGKSDVGGRIGNHIGNELPVDEVSPESVVHTTLQRIHARSAPSERSYFPETWLWETHSIGPTGRLQMEPVLPDSLTEWKGESVCLNSHQGLGISRTDSVTTFLTFFLDFTLPYSMVNQEKLPITVTVFSYHNEGICIQVDVGLEPPDDFILRDGEQTHRDITICGKKTLTFHYVLEPMVPGRKTISFWAKQSMGPSDRVQKTLLVKADGMEQEMTHTYFHCLWGNGADVIQNLNLTLPQDYVRGSEHSVVTAIADVMGPTVPNLERLFKMPTGCGEQNLATFAPSAQVMNYLTHMDQLTDKIRRKAAKFMKKGYQTQLQFRHKNGAFSAFGPKKKDPPSIWLTAFVVRTFAQARRYIYINDNMLRESTQWLKSHKVGEGGCFFRNGTGMVHNKAILGGMQDYTSTALTAYIMAALLEAGEQRFDSRILDAVRCLRSRQRFSNDIYSQALIAYAFSLFDPFDSIINSALQILDDAAIEEGSERYWQFDPSRRQRQRADPLDIEVTAYVLLAMLARSNQPPPANAHKVVRWLTKQRNPRGGFVSTQDTVVAIQALTKYAIRTYQPNADLKVRFPGDSENVAITDVNRMMVQTREVSPGEVRVNVGGRGCVILQASLTYNTKIIRPPVPNFDLSVLVGNVTNPFHRKDPECPSIHCDLRSLTVCTKYTAPGNGLSSNMAIIEVNMVSGWGPHSPSLPEIEASSPLVKDTNHVGDVLIVYLHKVMRQEVCLTIKVLQTSPVMETKQAIVHVYDYYSPDIRQAHTYSIEEVCTLEEQDASLGCLVDGNVH